MDAEGPPRSLMVAGSESLIFTSGTIYPLKDGNMDEQVEALGIHDGGSLLR